MTITTEEAELLARISDINGLTRRGAIIRSLAAERDALRQERDEANALVERMHEQDLLAIKAWQAAHPGSELTWPSSARLSAWCMGEVANVTAERDALKAERNAERSARFKVEAEFSHMQRRIARQRRALAKLYRKRHDRKAERDHLEKTAMQAAQRHEAAMARADGLLAEYARLWAAIEMAIDCIQDKDVIGARLTLTKALGETQ
jgi:hypothetical protein